MKALEKAVIPLSIIIGSIVIGGFIYFSNSSKTSQSILQPTQTPAVSPNEESQNPTLTESPTSSPIPTADDLLSIKKALSEKLGVNEDNIIVTISQNTGKHVRGGVRDKASETGGGYFLAAKTDGKWVIVYDGQANPTCGQIAPYDFPKEMVPECLNSSGQVVKR